MLKKIFIYFFIFRFISLFAANPLDNTFVVKNFNYNVHSYALIELKDINNSPKLVTLANLSYVIAASPNDFYGLWKRIRSPYALVVAYGYPEADDEKDITYGAYLLTEMIDDIRVNYPKVVCIFSYLLGINSNVIGAYWAAGFSASESTLDESRAEFSNNPFLEFTYRFGP